eukprot:COSAG01_NODE_1183_length_11346_cov_263.800302_1_plen_188_part_00
MLRRLLGCRGAQINEGLDRAEADLPRGAGALVVSSVGARAFSAGFDLSVMGSKEQDEAAVTQRAKLLQMGIDLCLRLFAFRRPVVMAASGHALALGAILLFTADVSTSHCLTSGHVCGAVVSFSPGMTMGRAYQLMCVTRCALACRTTRRSRSGFQKSTLVCSSLFSERSWRRCDCSLLPPSTEPCF